METTVPGLTSPRARCRNVGITSNLLPRPAAVVKDVALTPDACLRHRYGLAGMQEPGSIDFCRLRCVFVKDHEC